MWPAPPIRDDSVLVVIEPTHIYCGWFAYDTKKQLHLAAFESYSLEHVNQLTVTHLLNNFINLHKLTHAFVSFALSSPLMLQEFVRLSKASPTPLDFQSKQFYHTLWDYEYLHALDDGNHLFYLKGIKKSTYFEYQLVAYQTNLKLISITSCYAAQLAAYRKFYGATFRQSQLALDLAKHEYHIADSLSRDKIARLIHISPSATIAWHNTQIVAAMIGSYYCQQRSF